MAHILIIDDDEECLKILYHALVHAGHEVSALTRADRTAELLKETRPDLVITDIIMPGVMGGGVYEAVRQILGADVPVIVSSGTSIQVRRNDPLLVHLPKPVSPIALQKQVTSLLAARVEAKQ